MFNFNFFGQKSPYQRFLFILGVFMITVFVGLAILLTFFSDKLHIDPDKFPTPYRVAFSVLLVVYAFIRFNRLISKNEQDL